MPDQERQLPQRYLALDNTLALILAMYRWPLGVTLAVAAVSSIVLGILADYFGDDAPALFGMILLAYLLLGPAVLGYFTVRHHPNPSWPYRLVAPIVLTTGNDDVLLGGLLGRRDPRRVHHSDLAAHVLAGCAPRVLAADARQDPSVTRLSSGSALTPIRNVTRTRSRHSLANGGANRLERGSRQPGSRPSCPVDRSRARESARTWGPA